MKVLDLFSGIGGFSLGLERAGMETVAFCEIDPFCQKVLKKHWPRVPILEDVRKIDGDEFRGSINVICGGYPCQPFSVAGKRAGQDDDRHLWPEVARLVSEIRPRWFIGENVAGHITMGLDNVLSDLEELGYTVEPPLVIPAVALDAKHRRDRVWIIAHTERERGWQEQKCGPRSEDPAKPGHDGQTRSLANTHRGERETRGEYPRWKAGGNPSECCEKAGSVANTNSIGSQERLAGSEGCGKWKTRRPVDKSDAGPGAGNRQELGRWPAEPGVGRVAHGIPRRVDRLRALGNAVVPQIPEIIGRAIMEVEQL